MKIFLIYFFKFFNLSLTKKLKQTFIDFSLYYAILILYFSIYSIISNYETNKGY